MQGKRLETKIQKYKETATYKQSGRKVFGSEEKDSKMKAKMNSIFDLVKDETNPYNNTNTYFKL